MIFMQFGAYIGCFSKFDYWMRLYQFIFIQPRIPFHCTQD